MVETCGRDDTADRRARPDGNRGGAQHGCTLPARSIPRRAARIVSLVLDPWSSVIAVRPTRLGYQQSRAPTDRGRQPPFWHLGSFAAFCDRVSSAPASGFVPRVLAMATPPPGPLAAGFVR